jgi:hypothetical protein
MNKGYVMLVLLILVIASVVFVTYIVKSNEIKYNSANPEDIGISQIIETLENCQGYSEVQVNEKGGKFEFCSYDIDETNLEKLKSIENIKGNKICDFDEKDLDRECQLSDYLTSSSEIIWRFDWTQIEIMNNDYYILLFKKGGDYIFISAKDKGTIPYFGSIYVLENLDSELINKLKSN